MKAFIKLIKSLADNNRLRIIFALYYSKRLCVCQMIELLGLAPSTVSKHLSILENADAVQSEKVGRWIYFSLNLNSSNKEVNKVLKNIISIMKDKPEIKKDMKHLDKILTQDADLMCKRVKTSKK